MAGEISFPISYPLGGGLSLRGGRPWRGISTLNSDFEFYDVLAPDKLMIFWYITRYPNV